MSLQKMISDVETERAHNRVMGDSLADQLRNIKFRYGEEIDALIAAHLNRTDHTTAHHSYTTFCAMVAQGQYKPERDRVEALLTEDEPCTSS